MEKFSPILQWLSRGTNLQSIFEREAAVPEAELGGFLVLDKAIPLHETINLEAESLATSWERTHDYVEGCKEILDLDEPESLDKYEVSLIKETLGDPPTVAYPIYLMSVKGDSTPERVVYIGKTSSNNRRFRGGHTAITKLHAPEYDSLEKKLYLGCVVLLTKDNYLPLDWVNPLSKAESLLKSIEAQLIYHFKPELNTHHLKNASNENYIQIHIQNFSDSHGFLNDVFC